MLRARTQDPSPWHHLSAETEARRQETRVPARCPEKTGDAEKASYVHACLGKHLAFMSTFIFPSGQSAASWTCSGHHESNAQNGWCDCIPERDGLDAVSGGNPTAPPEAGPRTRKPQRAGLGPRGREEDFLKLKPDVAKGRP